MRQILPHLRRLTLVLVLVWVVVTPVAWWIAGSAGLLGSSISSAVTLILGGISIALFHYFGEGNRVSAVMAVTNLRLFGTLGAALAVQSLRPEWGLKEFYVWLLVNYLTGLAWETYILKSNSQVDFSWLIRPQSK